MKRILFLLIALLNLSLFQGFSQDNEFSDLTILLMDEQYEKLLNKSIKYTENEKYKKQPIPYLYVSMAYYNMSKDPNTFGDKHPKSFKNALKYAGKFRKKDKNKKYLDAEPYYFSELKGVCNEEVMSAYDSGDEKLMKKGYSTDKLYVGFAPMDPGPWLMKSTMEFRLANATEGNKSIEKAKEAMNNVSLETIKRRAEVREFYLYGLMAYCQYQIDNGSKTKAAELLDIAEPALGKEAEFQAMKAKL